MSQSALKMIRTNNKLLDYFSKNFQKFEFVKRKQFDSGEKIISQGSNARFIYILEEGITKCYVEEKNGKIFIQEFFGAGEIVGEIEVFCETTSFSNVETMTKVKAYQIAKVDFCDLLQKKSVFNILLIRALSAKLKDTAIRASYQQSYPLEYNLKKLLQLSSNQTKQISKTDLAHYLGITVRSLNRAMQEKKIRKTFKLTDH